MRDLVAVRKVKKNVILEVTGVKIFKKRNTEMLALSLHSRDVMTIRSNLGYQDWPEKLSLHCSMYERN